MLQQIPHTNRPVPMSATTLPSRRSTRSARSGISSALTTPSPDRDAFYAPLMSDWRNYEAWEEAGAIWTHQRANAAWKEILAEYERPLIDPAIDEALCAFVERRKEEGGAPTDF